MNGWNRTRGPSGPFFYAALGAHPEGAGRRAQGRRGAEHDNDRPASGGADIYRYILASGGADISAGRPASGGADRRPWSRIPRCIFDYIDLQICCRCATDTID
jgi:hypothetical protein